MCDYELNGDTVTLFLTNDSTGEKHTKYINCLVDDISLIASGNASEINLLALFMHTLLSLVSRSRYMER